MKFVFASYVFSPEFINPEAWLKRINLYAGILEALAKNHQVISIEQIDYEGTHFNNGVKYEFKRFTRAGHYFPLAMHRFIKSQQPDIVFIQGMHNPLQVIQLRMVLPKRIKIMVQNHAEKPAIGIRKVLQQLADRYIDAYLFASREMGLDWVRRGNLKSPEKIHEVMEVSSVFYPVEQASAKAKTGVNGETVFLWVGRLNENKDPLNTVRAFLRFADIYPEARLYMIYHTDELLDEIKALLNNSLHGDSVKPVGKVPHHELLYWFNSATFIVSASHYEGSGTAVCEAMSCGCIPILTDIFSFRMISDSGRCGILYEAGNPEAALSALVQSQQFDIVQMRRKVLAYFKSNLSFEAIANRFEEIAASF